MTHDQGLARQLRRGLIRALYEQGQITEAVYWLLLEAD